MLAALQLRSVGCAATLVAVGAWWLGGPWSEVASLLVVVGVPTAVAAAGWKYLADSLPSDEQLMESSSGAGLLILLPGLPSVAALCGLVGAGVTRALAGRQVFTPIYVRFFAGFGAVTMFGLWLVATRERTLAGRRRDSA